MKVLVVEDDVDIAELVAFNLERQGWECSLVHHGAEGWEQIQKLRPDLVILDVMLPGMDGMQIFRQMKEQEMTRTIPVIFLTARGALDDRLEGLSMGADDYVTKPFSPKEVQAAGLSAGAPRQGAGPLRIAENPFRLCRYNPESRVGHACEAPSPETG